MSFHFEGWKRVASRDELRSNDEMRENVFVRCLLLDVEWRHTRATLTFFSVSHVLSSEMKVMMSFIEKCQQNSSDYQQNTRRRLWKACFRELKKLSTSSNNLTVKFEISGNHIRKAQTNKHIHCSNIKSWKLSNKSPPRQNCKRL